MATVTWLWGHGYSDMATETWLQGHGYRDMVTVTWLQRHGYSDMAICELLFFKKIAKKLLLYL